MMGKVLFLIVAASVLNFGSGLSIPPTMGTRQVVYGNSNDPFANWFFCKFSIQFSRLPHVGDRWESQKFSGFFSSF